MNIINLTPNAIIIRGALMDGTDRVVPPSGTVAHVSATCGEVEGLPDPKTGTIYIVSSIVGRKVHRPDVLTPLRVMARGISGWQGSL